MKYIFFSILLGCLLISLSGFGQERDHKELSHEKKHKLAGNLITTGSYYNAIDHLKDLAKQHPKNEKYLMRLADAYFLSRDYKNAEEWYEKVVKMQKKITIALYKYAQCLKYNGKYVQAKDAFQKYSSGKIQDKEAAKVKSFAKNEVSSCDWAIRNSDTSDYVNVEHLGDHVNSRYSEFAPHLMNDTTLVFASLQSDTVITIDAHEAHTFHVKLLSSKLTDGEWGPHEELSSVNSLYENNANGALSPDGKWFYFTRCVPNSNHTMECAIYRSEMKQGVLQKPEKLDEGINRKGSSNTQPNVGLITLNNKKYEVLFFASNRGGGRGGMDIWYATLNKDGTFKTPVNAGNVINTIGNDITPYFHIPSHTLFFSSDYHHGFGGYDVFKTAGTLNKWQPPVNLGKPVNSSVDDTYYTLHRNWKEGFVVSNRPEGYHLTSETCCDDIYSLSIRNPYALNVIAYNRKDTSVPADAKFVILVKKSDTIALPFKDVRSYPDSITHLVQKSNDSLAYRYFESFHHDTLSVDEKISGTNYPDITQSGNYYSLSESMDYLVIGMGKYDTAYFIFRTTAVNHELSRAYSTDSLTRCKYFSGNTIDLLNVRFYLDSDSLPKYISAKKEIVREAEPEDEKSLTVTKFIEEIKQKNRNGLKIILNYDFDDEQFIKTHSASLDSLVDVLKEFPELKINIAAHTDDKGTHHYNMELSKKRARSIETYLHHKGIDRKRMLSTWHGETQPMVSNANPDGSDNPQNRHYNRRSEITIIED